MVLHSRPINKTAAAAMTAAAASSTPPAPRPAAVAPRIKPQVLQSGSAPNQLSFFFKRG
jgi:hypothetical protein